MKSAGQSTSGPLNNIIVANNIIRNLTAPAQNAIKVACTNQNVRDVEVVNNIIDTVERGILVQDLGTGNVRGVRILGNIVHDLQLAGISVNDATEVQVSDNFVYNGGKNGGAAVADRSGIAITNVTDALLMNNRATDFQGTKTQTYGLYLTGTTGQVWLSGSDLRGNLTDEILDNSTSGNIAKQTRTGSAQVFAGAVGVGGSPTSGVLLEVKDTSSNGGIFVNGPASDTANIRFRDTSQSPQDFNVDYFGGSLRFFTETGIGAGGAIRATLSNAGDFKVQANLKFESGTGLEGTLDHAITAARTWTLPDATGNIPALPTAATTETGSGAIVRQTSPTLAGTPVIGDGAGNDKLSFAAESSNPSCAAGNFFVWANSTDNRLKKCQNGTISDLDTTASGGGYDTLKGDSGTATRTGTEAIKIAGTSGEISTSAADGTDDTVTLSLPSTLSTAKTVSALWTFDRGTTSDQAILMAIAQPGAAGQRDSHFLDMRGTSFDTGGHNADWRTFVDVTSNAAASSLTWQSRIDAASFTTRAALSDGGVFDVATGFRIGGAATSGRFLRGNGTNFVPSGGAASGTGPCTNQFVRALNDDAAPTCATVVSADVDKTTFTGLTWLNNADSTWTFDTTGATSPVISFTGSAINVSTGTLQEGGVAVSLPSRTETLTNKTIDAEGTGNSLTTVEKIWIPAATCVSGTATLNWDDDPAAAEPTAACVAGTNTAKGVADFLDSATNAVQTHVKLPADWTGAVDAKFVWFTTVTANNVVWQIQGACVADAETDDPSFGTASTVADTAQGTANQLNDATITGIQANFAGSCAAGELLHLRLFRNPADASDTLAATARLVGIELTLRRGQ